MVLVLPRKATLLAGALLLPALAGCIGEGADDALQGSATATPSPDAGPLDGAAAPATVLTWGGFVRVGFVQDVPAHIEPTAGPYHSVVNASFHLDVVEAPDALQVQLDWDAPGAALLLMVIEPEDQGVRTYEAPQSPVDQRLHHYAIEGPLCLAIPADALRPGRWVVMAHSGLAVDAQLSFTVTATGGDVALVDEPVRESPQWLVEAATTRTILEPLACGASA